MNPITEFRIVVWYASCGSMSMPFEQFGYADTIEEAREDVARAKERPEYRGHKITKIVSEDVESEGVNSLAAFYRT